MYKTLEELQQKYPIGSTYQIYWNHCRKWCPTENDLIVLKQKLPNACNFIQKPDGTVWYNERMENKVEGYIFDGEYWYPAYRNWDGWQTIDEEDCNV